MPTSIVNEFGFADMATVTHPALELDSRYSETVSDISHRQAGMWVAEEISSIDLADADAIRARIRISEDRLSDKVACDLWPVSAHAHMQLVHQLKHLLTENWITNDDDISLESALKWADGEILGTDLSDPFTMADRIAETAEKLDDTEICARWPASACAHIKVYATLSDHFYKAKITLH